MESEKKEHLDDQQEDKHNKRSWQNSQSKEQNAIQTQRIWINQKGQFVGQRLWAMSLIYN